MAVPEHIIQQRLRLRRQADGQMEIFQRFLEMSGQALGMANLEGRIFFANSALCRLTGREHPEDLYELDMAVCYPPEGAKRLREEILPLVRQEGQWVGELVVVSLHGHSTPVIENVFLLRDDRGNPLCFATVMTDISERIHMEEELGNYRTHLEYLVANRTAELEKTNALLRAQIAEREQAEAERSRLAAVLENTTDLVAISTPDGYVHYVNKAGCETVGWAGESKEDIVKHNLAEVHPAWALRIIQEEGIPAVIKNGVWRGETAILRSDGQEIPTSQVIIAHRGGNGEVDYLSTILRDISMHQQAEEALKESERLLKDSQRLTKVGGWEFDVKMQTMTWTDETYRIHGFDPREFKPGSAEHAARSLECYPVEVRPLIQRAFQRCLDHGEAYDLEIPFMTAKGRKLWIRTTAEAVMEDGKVAKVYGNIQDITERKQAEELLRESEQRFRGLTEAMTQHVWIIDVTKNNFYHNPQSVAYTGLPEATAEDIWLVIHPSDISFVRAKWREAMPSGKLIEYTCRRRRHDGVYRWFLSRCVLLRNDQNKLQWIFGVDTDIDDLKHTEQALQDNLALLAEAERMGHTGSWRADLEMKKISVSAEIRRIYGIPEDENITEDTFISRMHPMDRSGALEKWQKWLPVIEKKTPLTMEYRIILPEGTIRHLFLRSEVMVDFQANPVGLQGTVQDITEKKMLEDEMIKAQKLESIGTLAGGLAHDYNNLLTTIMGSLEMIKMNLDRSNRIYPTVLKAEQAVLTARDLTRQLITFSRGGHPMIRIVAIDNILTETVRLALKGASTKVEWKIENDLPKVNIDENQISQVIYNIVMNALEAMAQSGKLFVEADEVGFIPNNALLLKEGSYIRLIFRDQGPGIRGEHISKLFDPYFSTKQMGNQKGMGLGLPICYSIMKKHNGHIQIDSHEGFGTSVTLYIPAALT